MSMTPVRTIDKIASLPNRALAIGKGAGGLFCLDSTAPANRSNVAMGRTGPTGVLSVGWRDTSTTPNVEITVWVWHEGDKHWWYAGGTADKRQIVFDADTGAFDGFYVGPNLLYFLTSDQDTANVWVGGEHAAT